MPSGRVRIAQPPGSRSCGGGGSSEWIYARGDSGAAPFINDLEFLKGRFPSDQSRAVFLETMRERMRLAAGAALPWDLVVLMQVAPDVLELKLPDWHYSGGMMHTRLYFTEPHDLPGHLVALRLRTKRPGPIGLEEQDVAAREASDLLLEFRERSFA
ncbi:hypothetical protein [Nocardioides lianchengensis]|uniref:hypothetical protein n=1 Tax=Nocardioides lianchengensis TaxID=1045774 RepID=UPI0011143D91|nr:hypothetical protein [Nocardioides lianchengensis]NYG08763.1 hypothetical protein [Nocardioides lianchengensis]